MAKTVIDPRAPMSSAPIRKLKLLLPVIAALFAALAQPLVAAAHPLGNFTVNHYSRLELYANLVRVRYVLDMAEIPTFLALSDIDLDRDGQISQAENDRYRTLLVEQLRQNLSLALNGRAELLNIAAADMSFPPGQGSLKTLRLAIWFEAPLPAGAAGTLTVNYQDNNAGQQVGWNEILLKAMAGVTVGATDVGITDQSDELRSYPVDMLSSPLNMRSARIDFYPGPGAAKAPALDGTIDAGVARAVDPFARLVHVDDLRPDVILVALLAAAVYGALHAFTPGHGKAMVGAYLVGSRGTPRHALLLGLTVTATHTLGVYALGVITLFAARYVLPERLYPILGALSGLMVVLIGITLFVSRVQSARRKPATGSSGVPGPGHEPDHDGLEPHSHGGLWHSHAPRPADGARVSIRNLLTLGISGGLVPCPSALLVMLGAMALNRVAFGMVLIVAFSLGLALVLTGTGLALVYAGRLFDRLPIPARSIQWVSAVSALIMASIGLVALWQALSQISL